MPRKKLIRTDKYPYHVTVRTNNKEFFPIELDHLWRIFLNILGEVQKKEEILIHSLVLMGNHFHLLLKTPKKNLDRVMYLVMKKLTAKIQGASGRINRIFGGRYKWSLVDRLDYFLVVVKYIYRNPVRASLVKKADKYPYSTLFYWKHDVSLPFRFDMPFEYIPNHSEGKLDDKWNFINWINKEWNALGVKNSLKSGLRRANFEPGKRPISNYPVDFRNDLFCSYS